MKFYWSRTNHVMCYKNTCTMAKDARYAYCTAQRWTWVYWCTLLWSFPPLVDFQRFVLNNCRVQGNSEDLFLIWTTLYLLIKLLQAICIQKQTSENVDSIGHRSCQNERKKTLLHKFVCFQMPNKRLQAWSLLIFEWEVTSFSKNDVTSEWAISYIFYVSYY